MAAPPVTPDDFKAVIPAANAKLCLKFLLSLVKFPTLVYKWMAWAMNADGTPSDNFKAWIGVAVGQLVAPGNLVASDGTFTDKITLTWNPVTGATYYEVFRATSNTSAGAVSLGTVTSLVTPFEDRTAPANTTVWYFVKSRNATDTSGFSEGESGFSDTSGGGGSGSTGSQAFTSNGSWTVPAGVTVIEVEMWGAGGGGGGSGAAYCPALSNMSAGGGGGAGEYRKVKQITVTPLEALTLIVDSAGGAGGHGTDRDHSSSGSGNPGGPSVLRRGATDLVSALGGGGGASGNCYVGGSGGGGAGGTGGVTGTGTDETVTAGAAGGNGTSASPVGVAGAGGAATAGNGAGGAGGALSAGAKGQAGKIAIVWPGPA